MSRRHNGEGSIYPVKDGYRGYVWCTNPAGVRYRKYVKGKTYDDTQRAWLKLRDEASRGPVASDVPSLEKFLLYWLEEIVRPNLAPLTYATRETFCRIHIIPYLGMKRLDRLQVADIRQWLNKLGRICQCCAQEKDANRSENMRRCCAIGQCCHAVLAPESRKDARNILRAALTCAMEEEIITRNPAAVIRLSSRNERTRKRRSWTVDEARQFLESARHDDDVLYAAYVLVLVLGLRKGELLGLTWDLIDLDRTELYISEQVQRVSGQLVRRRTKTEASEAPLPLPDLCVAALRLRKRQQDADRERAGDAWIDTGLVFTTRHGTPIEPRNFSRSFDRRVEKAKVASLLATLDVHPRVAMQILRHSKIAVTMEIYTQIPSAATRDALKKLGQWLDA